MSDLYKSSDEALIAFLSADNCKAFEELYNRYWANAYSLAFRKTASKETAEEIVQDFFTSLWLNRRTLQINTSFPGYIYSCIRYRVFNYYQKKYVRKNYVEAYEYLHTDIDNSTEDVISLNDLAETIDKQIGLLPVKCRAVYQLSRNEFKTTKEIASEMGISEKTVEGHLTKALKRLRLSLNQFFMLAPLFVSALF
ncbi:RNA polymerase sigma-70 factor [Pedobacter sp. HMF7647]|uniref:RNA polymerase sigma-70 factor n=1 Tax=Hufsiella arboris TaxID=2695275 RepID=A0A7K1YEN3_9SPHI|nr:RNA polymerase sigma-70 factor [Hufsiella arboris]MXV52478.1 RNA polymerase sigma-70 factor [Hufsiella arboris]